MSSRRSAAFVSFVLLAISGGCTSNTFEKVEGVVVDQRSKEPIFDARVEVGGVSTTSDEDGRFSLSDVANDAELAAERCGYSSAESPPSEDEVVLELEPKETTGRITSNLTGKPIPGVVAVQGSKDKMKVKNSGRISLFGLCDGTRIKVSSAGFESETLKIDEQDSFEIELSATPETTLKQQIAWEREGAYDKTWSLVHPDARSYITEEELTAHFRARANDGYQMVGVTVKDVVTVEWTFPQCGIHEFGPKAYPGTAALTVVYEESAPNGGRSSTRGVAHLVQTKDGLWRWFPTAGCDFQPES